MDARTVFVLLHDFPTKDLRQAATFEKLTSLMSDPHLPIRELAYWHLLKLSAGAGRPLPDYNAAWGQDQRDKSVDDWKKLIADSKLPPPQPMAPPGQ